MYKDRLVSLLLGANACSHLELEHVLDGPQYRGVAPEQAVVDAGLVNEWRLCEILAHSYRTPLVHLVPGTISEELRDLIPREVALNYGVVATEKLGKVLTLAMADPSDVVAEDVVRHKTGCSVMRVMAPRSEILAVLSENQAPTKDRSIASLLKNLPTDATVEAPQVTDVESTEGDDEAQSQPIIQIVSAILTEAVKMRASDIHVEPQAESVRVRCRVDGLLRPTLELPNEIKNACISRFKIIASMDIAEKRLPQDGRTRVRLSDRTVDMRVSTLPSMYGEKVVARILDKSRNLLDLDRLGLSPDDHRRFCDVLEASQGLILITGPTGSGKTATLYSALSRLNKPEDNIITVEDPVEFQVDGITQVQVHVKAGRTFATALRAILRQDPDVVLVGEIRDLETAEIAVQAAQTGHLVLSTLHTNDTASTISRLVQMGLPAYLVASTLMCVVAQRLVLRICPECRFETDLAETLAPYASLLGSVAPPTRTFAGRGCKTCDFTGYHGRMGVYEILVMSDRLREMVINGASIVELATAAREEGLRSVLEDGIAKVSAGHTTLEAVLRSVTVERRGGRMCRTCLRPLDDNFEVCPHCDEGVARHCPTCHLPAEETWRVCPGCRTRLDAAPAAAPAQPQPRSQASQAMLPLFAARSTRREGIGRTHPPPSDRYRILAVDDDEIVIDVVREVLTSEGGYEVVVAQNGREGLEQAALCRPDLIISDIVMPEMDGLEFLRQLRSRLQTALVPFILMTSRASPDSELRGLEAGADDYLVKPVEPDRLLGRVASVLRRASPRVLSSGAEVVED